MEVLFIWGIIISLNWIVKSYGDLVVIVGDEIVIFYMEYYLNIIFW